MLKPIQGGRGAMAEYRAYLVGDDDHFVAFRAHVFDSDTDATVWAKQLVHLHDIELWSGERFVVRLNRAAIHVAKRFIDKAIKPTPPSE